MTPTYQTQPGRDLHWALTSPMMMRSPHIADPRWRPGEAAKYQGLLRQLDRPGSPLHRNLRQRKKNNLGHYFETLLRTWIREVPPARLRAANWQVYHGGRTIGEFDLLFERSARIWHWELALKFYLGHPAPDGQFRWYGPDPKDRLDRKWAKMRGHQLRLQTHPAAEGALETLGIDGEVSPRAFIKGYIFLPLSLDCDVAYPPDINPAGLRGWWIHRSQLEAHRDTIDPNDQRRWLILGRRRWLSPAHVTDGDRLLRSEQLQAAIPPDRTKLVAGLTVDDSGDPPYAEVSRGLVVPDGWPWHE